MGFFYIFDVGIPQYHTAVVCEPSPTLRSLASRSGSPHTICLPVAGLASHTVHSAMFWYCLIRRVHTNL